MYTVLNMVGYFIFVDQEERRLIYIANKIIYFGVFVDYVLFFMRSETHIGIIANYNTPE